MTKISADQFMVTYDDELGVVYIPRKGIVKTTTPNHAKAIEACLTDYLNGNMSSQDKSDFENYMEKDLKDIDDLPIVQCKTINERDVLRRLEIVIANDCNLRCKYCYAHGGNYDMKAQRMTPDVACKYLTSLLIGKYRYVKFITFFGGEPTLCPETIEAVCKFFDKNVKCGLLEKMPIFLMISNGTLIDENMANTIHKYGINVTVSIDGPQEINDLLRVDAAGNGTFFKVSKGIDNLKKVGSVPTLLEATYTSKHKEMGYTKEGIQDYLKNHFEVKNVTVADCCSGGLEKNLEYTDWDTHIGNDGDFFSSDIRNTYNCLTSGVFETTGCDAGFGSCVLLPNGEIYPCHMFINKPEYLMANYNESNYFDFSNYKNVTSQFDKIDKLKSDRCTDCWAKTVCLSCPAALLLEKSSKKLDAECYTRRILEKHMILKCAKFSLAKKQLD